jgi:chemotaxis protein histidine kinase CheA
MKDSMDDDLDEEILEGFLEECFEISQNLRTYLDGFSQTGSPKLFEQFGQNIDRIMGAAKSIGLMELGELCLMGKELGYKSSQVKDLHQQLSLQSVLSQILRQMDKILQQLKKKKSDKDPETAPLIKKLKEVSAKLGNLRATV